MTERLHFHFSLSCTGEGNCNPLQCACLQNPRDGRVWWAAIYGVAQSRTRLSGGLAAAAYILHFRSDQSLSRVRLFATPWITSPCQASLSITNSRSSLRLTSIQSVMPSSHLILCRPLLLLPPIPSSIRVFPSESTLRMRWPKYWSFSFSIIPSKEIPGLISFRMDWLDLLHLNCCKSKIERILGRHICNVIFIV